MILSELEIDILGEMNFDTHELWEWYSFIRTHYPNMPENEVIEYGYKLFERWIERGWLVFYKSRADEKIILPDKFLQQIRQMGEDAGNAEKSFIVLELDPKACRDVSWLKPFDIGDPK